MLHCTVPEQHSPCQVCVSYSFFTSEGVLCKPYEFKHMVSHCRIDAEETADIGCPSMFHKCREQISLRTLLASETLWKQPFVQWKTGSTVILSVHFINSTKSVMAAMFDAHQGNTFVVRKLYRFQVASSSMTISRKSIMRQALSAVTSEYLIAHLSLLTFEW